MSSFHFGGDFLSQSLECCLSSMAECIVYVSSLKMKLDEDQVRALKVFLLLKTTVMWPVIHMFMRIFLYL